MTTLIAVPVKDLVNAKQRLVPLLSPPERSELARAMLEDVLEALGRARLGEVLVVTRDPSVESLARRLGAAVLREDDNRGHTEAIAHAAKELDVDAVIIGATRRSAFYHMLRGHVVKGLMKRLPRDCHLMICN